VSRSPFFSDDELADAAADFITSSTLHRFALKAKEASRRARLRRHVQMVPQMIPSLVERAKSLWYELRRSSYRDIPEVELAILLALLSETAAPGVDELLVDVSLIDQPSVAWIGSLARRLLQEHASNTSRSLTEYPRRDINIRVENLPHIDHLSEMPTSPKLRSGHERASQPPSTLVFT
jgi:hypothetical protein